MDVERRMFMASGMALIAGAACAQDGPGPVAGDPSAPFWPPVERFPLWPGQPPGAPRAKIKPNWTMNNAPPNRELWIRGVSMPEVHVFRAAKPDGSALLVFPGGGYEFLSVQNEGIDAAERFNSDRTTVFVLTYRLPVEGWAEQSLVPLQDAQRAMRLIRSRADQYRIDPARLGVLGFSAGGHLAADLGVSSDARSYAPIDAADAQSARPAFLGLVYPVISLDPKTTLGNSASNLLGAEAAPELLLARSPAMHVTKETPPSFIVAAFDDPLVLVPNSLEWIDACRRAKASVEAHLFADGGHGFGFHLPAGNSGSRWPDLFALWARKQGG